MPVTTIDLRDAPTTPDELGARILDATMTCLSRFGFAKTTIDDVAREAGCSRATVYRYFANRNTLVVAAVDRELAVLTAAITAAADAADTLEDAIVAMFVTAARRITAHAALQRALELEPEVVLPSLSFEGGDRLFAQADRAVRPRLRTLPPPDARAARGRVVHAGAARVPAPRPHAPLDDRRRVRSRARASARDPRSIRVLHQSHEVVP